MGTGPAPMRTHGATTGTKAADGFRRLEVTTGVGRRRRWSDDEKARIVAESLDPSTTSSAVARRYGLHASQLFVWHQQLAAPAAREAPEFVPVVVAEGSVGRNGRESPLALSMLLAGRRSRRRHRRPFVVRSLRAARENVVSPGD
jgi:transposase-like protein